MFIPLCLERRAGVVRMRRHARRRPARPFTPLPSPLIAVIRSRVPARLATLVALLTLAATGLGAQVGSTTDILTGVVSGPDSKPLAGATVDATAVDGQITRHAQTGNNGRYTILFPDGGGQYRVTVRLIGMAPISFVVNRQADEDRLVRDVSLSPTSSRLQEVVVSARRRGNGNDRPTPGATGRNISGDQAERLPIDASDLAALAALAPGVVPIGATDSTSTQFSVAGQRPTANNITLDGLSFGGGSIPQDATRTTRIITNTYDVARGQFSGGLVATTTKSGNNSPAGSFSYSLRDRALEWGGADAGAFGAQGTQNQLGGGFGGPIVKDKLFFFTAAQGRWREDDLASLLSANNATLRRLGVASDSVARFLALVNGQGVPELVDGVGNDKSTNNGSALARMDYIINDSHSLMFRADWRLNTQDPTRVSATSLPMAGGTSRDQGGGIMVVAHLALRQQRDQRDAHVRDDRRSDVRPISRAARGARADLIADCGQRARHHHAWLRRQLIASAGGEHEESGSERRALVAARRRVASHQAGRAARRSALRPGRDEQSGRHLHLQLAFGSGERAAGDVHAHPRANRALGYRDQPGPLPRRHVAKEQRAAGHLWRATRRVVVRRCPRGERGSGFGLRTAHRSLPVRGASQPARRLHVDARSRRAWRADDHHPRRRRRFSQRDADRRSFRRPRVRRESRERNRSWCASAARFRHQTTARMQPIPPRFRRRAHPRCPTRRRPRCPESPRSIRISDRLARGVHRSACSGASSTGLA